MKVVSLLLHNFEGRRAFPFMAHGDACCCLYVALDKV